ncbi:MAG: aminotransferase class V-fold PLP-dependent enzyme [Actinomycetota bacterium]|nr:aminotransferase class V-fold PLP-dependent enzyme [Actinomycetota bacterium]
MNLKGHFSRFLESEPGRLHFAAHSHHPWPDVTFEAHQQAWLDAAEMMDDKWDHIFGSIIPETKNRIAGILGLEDGSSLAFAPNTHEFVVRIFSSIEPPVRVLSTDSEFHSFTRQSRRWEEEGLAIVDRVPAMPFETFGERFTREARSGAHDLIFLSEVFFDSGFVVSDIDRIVSSVSDESTLIVVDGYHAFMARPTNIGAIQDRAFYLAGGYKYAMSGEGACFLHSPTGYVPRPVNTGWYAGFGQLETGVSSLIPYATDGTRFSGATFDPSGVYRMNSVLRWLEEEGIDTATISSHVASLQDRFLATGVEPGELVPPRDLGRGNFLTFRTPDASTADEALRDRRVITDHRGDRLRIGFGIYQDESDVDRLSAVLADVLAEIRPK